MTRTAKTTVKPASPRPAPAVKRAALKTKVAPVAEPAAVTAPPAAPAEVSPTTACARPAGKLGLLVALLERDAGASLEEMTQTAWPIARMLLRRQAAS